jgi:hypothetical protein
MSLQIFRFNEKILIIFYEYDNKITRKTKAYMCYQTIYKIK